jgi:hypothetical protein
VRVDRGRDRAYSLVEDRTLWDGFVWTVDTVATTGSIQAPQDTAGEVVKVVLTFLGVGTLFYALVSLTELVVTAKPRTPQASASSTPARPTTRRCATRASPEPARSSPASTPTPRTSSSP